MPQGMTNTTANLVGKKCIKSLSQEDFKHLATGGSVCHIHATSSDTQEWKDGKLLIDCAYEPSVLRYHVRGKIKKDDVECKMDCLIWSEAASSTWDAKCWKQTGNKNCHYVGTEKKGVRNLVVKFFPAKIK